MLIDTHAHLFYPNFNGEIEEIIQRAKNAGVEKIIVPATDLASSGQVIQLCDTYPEIYGAVGVHPHDSKEWNNDLIKDLKELAAHPKIVAIGEIGLDYFYDFSPKEKQIEAFKSQIELAIEIDKPIIVHNRESDEDMMNIISSYCGTGLKAQFHCFNASLEDARKFIGMGHFISFTGNITFKKLDSLRNVAAGISPEHLLLETDSPFMTPVPFRGKRNEPAYVSYVAEKLAEIYHLTIDDIARLTSYNAFKLFGIGNIANAVYTYKIGNSLYINVTNRCNADCVFCDRKGDAVVAGYNLKMKKSDEPNAEVYIQEIGDPKKYKEIVFCGYGEPTIRWDVVKLVAQFVKANGGKTRLNTNGHGNKIQGKDITEEMVGKIDTVSISLNADNAKDYAKIMRVDESYFYDMLDFVKKSIAKNIEVVLSVVRTDNINIEKAEQLTESLGAKFRIRELF